MKLVLAITRLKNFISVWIAVYTNWTDISRFLGGFDIQFCHKHKFVGFELKSRSWQILHRLFVLFNVGINVKTFGVGLELMNKISKFEFSQFLLSEIQWIVINCTDLLFYRSYYVIFLKFTFTGVNWTFVFGKVVFV